MACNHLASTRNLGGRNGGVETGTRLVVLEDGKFVAEADPRIVRPVTAYEIED
jgi:hypothetical protein